MDLEDQSLLPPPAKRPRLSLEAIPETLISRFGNEGQEEPAGEESTSEKFWKLVKLVDFSLDDTTQHTEDTNITKTQAGWAWADFQTNVTTATSEIASLVSLIEWIRTNKQISPMRIVKPDLPPKVANAEFLSTFAAKKNQLQRATMLFESASKRLRSAVTKTDIFFEQVMQLRKVWRVVAPEKQALGAYHSQFYVDVSFFQNGSRMKLPLIPLTKSPSGDVEIEHPQFLPFSCVTVATGRHSDDVLLDQFPVPRSLRATGVKQCHDYLCALQQSMWNNIAFKQTSRDCLNLPDSSDTLASETAIRLRLPSIQELLHFKLIRRSEVCTSSDTGVATSDSSSTVATLPLCTSSTEGAALSWDSQWLAMSVECAFHQNVHLYHLELLKRDAQLAFSSHSTAQALQLEAGNAALAKPIGSIAQHLAMTDFLARSLSQLRDGISRSLGACRIRWIPTGRALVSSCDLEYAVRFVETITVRNAQIFVETSRVISTPSELIQYLLHSISTYVAVQLYHQIRSLDGVAQVSREGQNLSFTLIRQGSIISISVVPGDYCVHINMAEEFVDSATGRIRSIRQLEWAELPGGNHLEKVTGLILRKK